MPHNPHVLTVSVDSHLSLPALAPEVCQALKDQTTHSNPAFFKAKRMGFRYTKEPREYVRWLEAEGKLSIPRGRADEMRAVLAEHGLKFKFDDQRHEGKPEWADGLPAHNVDLWKHQDAIVDAIIEVEQGVVRAPTGSGKTTAGIAAISAVQLPTLIIVWSAKLLEQWVERLCDELGVEEDDIGVVGGGKTRWRPITVAMQQTLARSPAKLDKACKLFGFLICDEVQRFAADTFVKVVDVIPARFRIGLSDDESRKDQKHFLIYDSFGKVIFEVKANELEDLGLVMPVLVRIIPTKFKADWYVDDSIEMSSLLREANRAREDGDAERARDLQDQVVAPDFGKLVDAMVEDDERNAQLYSLAHSTKAPTLVLAHRRALPLELQAEMVRRGRQCGLLLGGKENEKEFTLTVHKMRAGLLAMGTGTYQAVGQGLDIKPAAIAICATPIHANKQFFRQVRGRVCRKAKGKRKAELWYLWDREVFGLEPLMNLRRYNGKENVVVEHGSEWLDVDTFMERNMIG